MLYYPFLFVLIQTASRSSEIAGLQWVEVFFAQDLLIIQAKRVKTKKDRRIPLTISAKKILVDLRKDAIPENNNVFLPANIDVLNRNESLSRYFRRSSNTDRDNTGIKNFVMYGLRHSVATHLLMNGVDIGTVSQIMGHSNISQTMKYTRISTISHSFCSLNALCWQSC